MGLKLGEPSRDEINTSAGRGWSEGGGKKRKQVDRIWLVAFSFSKPNPAFSPPSPYPHRLKSTYYAKEAPEGRWEASMRRGQLNNLSSKNTNSPRSFWISGLRPLKWVEHSLPVDILFTGPL